MTEIYLHIDARMADYMAPHPYEVWNAPVRMNEKIMHAHASSMHIYKSQSSCLPLR